jgi:hypothetical protein
MTHGSLKLSSSNKDSTMSQILMHHSVVNIRTVTSMLLQTGMIQLRGSSTMVEAHSLFEEMISMEHSPKHMVLSHTTVSRLSLMIPTQLKMMVIMLSVLLCGTT